MAQRKIDIDKLPSNNLTTSNKKIELSGKVDRMSPKRRSFSDDVRDIAVSLFEDVILPAIKSTINDFVSNGVEMMLWGGSSASQRPSRNRRVDYHKAYNDRRTYNRQSSRKVSYHSPADSVDEIVFKHRQDAERCLAKMYELINEYGFVTIGDLYSMVGWTSTITHERYGWAHLDRVRIIRHADGYLMDLPDPVYRD